MKARISPKSMLRRVTIGSALTPQSSTKTRRSERCSRALPLTSFTSATAHSPMKVNIAEAPSDHARAAAPMRVKTGSRATERRAPLRSGTAAARSSNFPTPSGRPSRSISTRRSAAMRMKSLKKTSRPVAHPVSALLSNRTLRSTPPLTSEARMSSGLGSD